MMDRRPDAIVRYADVMIAVDLRVTEILRLECGRGGDKDAGLGRLRPRSCD